VRHFRPELLQSATGYSHTPTPLTPCSLSPDIHYSRSHVQNVSEQRALVQQLMQHPAVSADIMHKVADAAHKHAHR
jgi:hypothetical protein